jgi:hypothetical protein
MPLVGKQAYMIIGWVAIVAGIALWVSGVWLGPAVFFAGLIVETIGYVVATFGGQTNKKSGDSG